MRRHIHFRSLILPLSILLLAPTLRSPAPVAPASGDAIEAAVQNAEAELARAEGDSDD